MRVVKSVPNLFTLANLYCGFLSISSAAHGHYEQAAIFILIGMLLDSMDGRLARLLHVDSDFGKQLDSLADIVTFGIAPSFLIYYIYFSQYHIYGIILAGLFPLFGAYRLARFNISSNDASLSYFTGVPITAAGGILAVLTLFEETFSQFLILLIFMMLSFLMVSKIRVPSFKRVSLPKSRTVALILLGCILLFVSTHSYDQFPYLLYFATPLYVTYVCIKFVRYKKRKAIDEDSQPQL